MVSFRKLQHAVTQEQVREMKLDEWVTVELARQLNISNPYEVNLLRSHIHKAMSAHVTPSKSIVDLTARKLHYIREIMKRATEEEDASAAHSQFVEIVARQALSGYAAFIGEKLASQLFASDNVIAFQQNSVIEEGNFVCTRLGFRDSRDTTGKTTRSYFLKICVPKELISVLTVQPEFQLTVNPVPVKVVLEQSPIRGKKADSAIFTAQIEYTVDFPHRAEHLHDVAVSIANELSQVEPSVGKTSVPKSLLTYADAKLTQIFVERAKDAVLNNLCPELGILRYAETPHIRYPAERHDALRVTIHTVFDFDFVSNLFLFKNLTKQNVFVKLEGLIMLEENGATNCQFNLKWEAMLRGTGEGNIYVEHNDEIKPLGSGFVSKLSVDDTVKVSKTLPRIEIWGYLLQEFENLLVTILNKINKTLDLSPVVNTLRRSLSLSEYRNDPQNPYLLSLIGGDSLVRAFIRELYSPYANLAKPISYTILTKVEEQEADATAAWSYIISLSSPTNRRAPHAIGQVPVEKNTIVIVITVRVANPKILLTGSYFEFDVVDFSVTISREGSNGETIYKHHQPLKLTVGRRARDLYQALGAEFLSSVHFPTLVYKQLTSSEVLRIIREAVRGDVE